MSQSRLPSVRIFHNNLWAKYKGAIFSELYAAATAAGIKTSFAHVAEFEPERAVLAGVDRSYHRYPYTVLFAGSYDSVPLYRLILATTTDIFRNPCDLVVLPGYHRVEYWAMLLACILLWRRRAVFCDSTANEQQKTYWKEKAKGLFFRRCDGFFCYGIRSKEYIESYVGAHPHIFYRCQAAALPHDYDASAVIDYYRNVCNVRDTARFLYIGRLAAEKGLYDLIDAFKLVQEHLPDARLEIVGSGPIQDELVVRTERAGLSHCVFYLGAKRPDEIGALLLGGTAMILPSEREPWGLVVNEALSYGCPVVVSNVCGCVPELVLDGVTGYSYPVGDVGALGRAMLKVARMAKDRLEIAQRCLEVIARYTPRSAALEILRGCVALLGEA